MAKHEPILFGKVGYEYICARLALQEQRPVGTTHFSFHPSSHPNLDPDILGSEQLWQYLTLQD